MHVGQDSADEVTARRILHDLDVADVIATSEEEARQRQAEARQDQAQLRSALRASLRDGALPLPSPESSLPEISPPEISPPEISPPTADPPPAALPCDALPRRPTPRLPWLQSCDAQCGGGCRASGGGVPRAWGATQPTASRMASIGAPPRAPPRRAPPRCAPPC